MHYLSYVTFFTALYENIVTVWPNPLPLQRRPVIFECSPTHFVSSRYCSMHMTNVWMAVKLFFINQRKYFCWLHLQWGVDNWKPMKFDRQKSKERAAHTHSSDLKSRCQCKLYVLKLLFRRACNLIVNSFSEESNRFSADFLCFDLSFYNEILYQSRLISVVILHFRSFKIIQLLCLCFSSF